MCRCFVGTPQQMYDALIGKLSKLPPDVKVCFARCLELSEAQTHMHVCKHLKAAGVLTLT